MNAPMRSSRSFTSQDAACGFERRARTSKMPPQEPGSKIIDREFVAVEPGKPRQRTTSTAASSSARLRSVSSIRAATSGITSGAVT
jgi:hypothetical protein